ncbi:MAG: hypothetical protein M3Q65_08450, partial [Chloroflexota bacterium]|nr:hypothetical protein [Chloroflexota bacterium]
MSGTTPDSIATTSFWACSSLLKSSTLTLKPPRSAASLTDCVSHSFDSCKNCCRPQKTNSLRRPPPGALVGAPPPAAGGGAPTSAPGGARRKDLVFWGRQQFLQESNEWLTQSVRLAAERGGFNVKVELFSNDEHGQKEVVAMESGV